MDLQLIRQHRQSGAQSPWFTKIADAHMKQGPFLDLDRTAGWWESAGRQPVTPPGSWTVLSLTKKICWLLDGFGMKPASYVDLMELFMKYN